MTTPAKQNNLAWLPYVLPLVLFFIVPMLTKAAHLPYPVGYPIGTAIVLAVEIWFRKTGAYSELGMSAKLIPALTAIGILLCGMWFAVDKFTPHFAFLGGRESYDPFTHITNPASLYGFLATRFIGLVIAAPLAEELFYRSFLLRYLANPDDFKSAPVGIYEVTGCAAAILLMAASHPEWLAAAIFSLAMNGIVYKTRSVGACVYTHAVTNLALGIVVIVTHQWIYW